MRPQVRLEPPPPGHTSQQGPSLAPHDGRPHFFAALPTAAGIGDFVTQEDRQHSIERHNMTRIMQHYAAGAALLLAASPVHAGPCAQTIARVQAEVSTAIESRLGSAGWKPESLSAMRSYQPTPRSLAATEGREGARFEFALDALDRARTADRRADSTTCHQQLSNARAVLRR